MSKVRVKCACGTSEVRVRYKSDEGTSAIDGEIFSPRKD